MDIPGLAVSIRRYAEMSYARSGGPGGQHVNKTSTKVVLSLPLGKIGGLNDEEISRLRAKLGGRINADDKLIVHSGETRSQRINIEEAYSRAEKLIISAARLPKHRKPTKPSRAAKENRLASKRLHSLKKTQRNFPGDE